jgi:hypothetical protein
VSSIATHAGRRAPFQRFAAGFGGVSAVLSVLGLLVAVGLSLPTAWWPFGGHDHSATPAYTDLTPSTPARLSVAGAGLVVPLVVSDAEPRSTLADPPTDAPLASWWSGSAKPGTDHGQTVLTGHSTDSGGALSGIGKLDTGDFVDLLTERGTMRYQVTGVHVLDPARMASATRGYFKQHGGGGRLVVVSAEAWDGRSYQRSVVVLAKPLGQPTG